MSDETTLLSCPFCGGEAVFHDCLRPPETYPCRVYCDSCWAEVGGYSTEAEAIAAWNTRHVETCENMREKFGYKRLFVCSECGVSFDPDCEINYCPSCGRKVVGA